MFLCCSRRATALPPTATTPFPATVRSGCREMLRVKQCLLREYKSIHKRRLCVCSHCVTAIFCRAPRYCLCSRQSTTAPCADGGGWLWGSLHTRTSKTSCPTQMIGNISGIGHCAVAGRWETKNPLTHPKRTFHTYVCCGL